MLKTLSTITLPNIAPLLTSSISGSKNNESTPHLTPREIWIRKEKVIKTKFFIILIISHLFWVLSFKENTKIVKENILEIEPNHHLVKIEGNLLIPPPLKGTKKLVSLIKNDLFLTSNTYIRQVESMGMKNLITLEVHEKDLGKIQKISSSDHIKILPYSSTSHIAKSKKGTRYEMVF